MKKLQNKLKISILHGILVIIIYIRKYFGVIFNYFSLLQLLVTKQLWTSKNRFITDSTGSLIFREIIVWLPYIINIAYFLPPPIFVLAQFPFIYKIFSTRWGKILKQQKPVHNRFKRFDFFFTKLMLQKSKYDK